MRTRYTYLGESTIEVVIGSESVEVNILPAAEASSDPLVLGVAQQPEQGSVGPSPADPVTPQEAIVPVVTRKQRTTKGLVRAMWTAVFSFGGEALVYGLNNLTTLNLPPGVGLAVGAIGYGAKAAIWPSTRL